MNSLVYYALAAITEIAGCFAFWAVFRLEKHMLWLVPGVLSLMAFAWFLTRIDTEFAGRAYAAYGGIYILASLLWMWLVERQQPDRWDVTGVLICLVGAAIILWAPRSVGS